MQDQTCNLLNLNPRLLEVKVSVILLTARLKSASILHQVHNIKNSFAYTGFMDPIISIITTAAMINESHTYFNMFSIIYARVNCA